MGEPILVKNDKTLWRDEIPVSFQAGSKKCGVAWCKKGCDKQWIKRELEHLANFSWTRTRHIVFTVDPGRFKTPQESYEYVKNHRLIPELIRKLKRGKKKKEDGAWVWEYKPITVLNYRYYQEWHESGFPHWHVLIEIDGIGWRTKIGGARLRSLWKAGSWVTETYFKTSQHWRHMMGDFSKSGYLHKAKDHQGKLPPWALDIPGYIMPRSSGQRLYTSGRRDAWDDYCDRAKEEKVDLATGEILAGFKFKVPRVKLTYREKFKGCKQMIWAKITTATEVIEGIFKIPYRELYDRHKGTYIKKLGYVFRGSIEDVKEFLTRREKIIKIIPATPNTWSYERVGFLKWAYCLRPGGNYV